MSILKRVPWVSLTLVLLSYSTLGWMMSETNAPPFVWEVVIFTILLLLITLTTTWSRMSRYLNFLLKSKVRTFGISVLAAFLFFLMLAWFRVFLDTLLILSATILVRIDFQAAGFNQKLAFGMTSIFSFAGLALGALIYKSLLTF
jgi:hypothetical protein